MDVFENVTVKQILKAVEKLHGLGVTPSKLYVSKAVAIGLVKLFNDNSVVTKGTDGKDYIWGMEVMPDNRLDDDTMYLK